MSTAVAIIGAGPAGLFCAVQCGLHGLKPLVLEKNASAGKKLLLSGSGKCNITHSGNIKDFLQHYGEQHRFVKPALFNFSNSAMIEFFKARNLNLAELNEGKVFPETQNGKDVLDILVKECEQKEIRIEYGSPVIQIAGKSGGFEIVTETRIRFADVVVISTGGKSYPGTGSSGDGYSFARSLGHTVEKPAPALAPVIVKNFQYASCAGISFEQAPIHLYRNNKKVRSGEGSVLFTHKGLSGPGILDMSRYIQSGDVVKIALVKYRNREDFESDLICAIELNGRRVFRHLLKEFEVPERLIDQIFESNNIPPDIRVSVVDKQTRRLIVDAFVEFSLCVECLGDFSEAMVTTGGIPANEINKNTMESRIVPNLFFAGEICDVDGDTGGYNLQFAFSSGMLAGKSIAQHLKKEKK